MKKTNFNFNINEDSYTEDGELRKKISNNIIIVSITNRYGDIQGKAALVIKKMSNIVEKVIYKYGKYDFYCNDHDELLNIMKMMSTNKLLDIDPNLSIKITKKSNISMNDSLTESTSNTSGTFMCEFTYHSDEFNGAPLSLLEAAKVHVKWLINQGLMIDFEEKRYSVIFHITYENKKLYDALVRWLAWDFGMTSSINNPCPKSEKAELEAIINKGSWFLF